MRFFLYMALCLIFAPITSFAELYPVPVSIKYRGSPWPSFEVEWGWADVSGIDIPVPSDYDNVVLAVNVRRSDGPVMMTGDGSSWANIGVIPGETFASAAQRLAPRLPSKFDDKNLFPWGTIDGCVGIVFRKGRTNSWAHVFSPATTCVAIPPPEEPVASCDVVTPSIVLDHGEIGVGKTVSSVVSAALSLECNRVVSAKITFGSSTLKLGSMVAALSVPNTSNGAIQLNKGANTLSVSSLLTGSALAIGTFSASTVMTITFV